MLLSIIIDQLSIIIDNASPCGKCGFPPVLCRSKHDEIASKVLELEMPHDCGSQLFATTKVEKRQNIDSSAKSDRPVCSRLYPPVIGLPVSIHYDIVRYDRASPRICY